MPRKKASLTPVQPTLRGLIFVEKSGEDRGHGTILPWTHVSLCGLRDETSYWRHYDTNGTVTQINGRPALLEMKGRQAQWLALAAQRRSFQKAWSRRELALQADAVGRAQYWFMLGYSAVVAIVLGFFTKMIMTDALWAMRPNALGASTSWFVALAALVSWALLLGGCALLPAMAVLGLRRSRSTFVSVDADGLHARLTCGAHLRVNWSQVQAMRVLHGGFVRFDLSDGQRIWLGRFPHHVTAALAVIWRAEFPEHVSHLALRRRSGPIRAVVYAVLAFSAIGSLVGSRLGLRAGLLVILPAIAVVIVPTLALRRLMLYHVHREHKAAACSRLQRRAAGHHRH
jgi:hypothetical protein